MSAIIVGPGVGSGSSGGGWWRRGEEGVASGAGWSWCVLGQRDEAAFFFLDKTPGSGDQRMGMKMGDLGMVGRVGGGAGSNEREE